jgi:hypothetical protein
MRAIILFAAIVCAMGLSKDEWTSMYKNFDPSTIAGASAATLERNKVCQKPARRNFQNNLLYCERKKGMKEILNSKPESVRASLITICNKMLASLCTLQKVGHYSEALVAKRVANKKWKKDFKKFGKQNKEALAAWKSQVAVHAKHRDTIKLRALQRAQVCSYSKKEIERQHEWCRKQENLKHVLVTVANPYPEFNCLHRLTALCEHHKMRGPMQKCMFKQTKKGLTQSKAKKLCKTLLE